MRSAHQPGAAAIVWVGAALWIGAGVARAEVVDLMSVNKTMAVAKPSVALTRK